MKFFVYSLLFSLLFSLGAKLHVFVNYLANQTYYAQVLCKNKAVKNSCCKGKCAVEKELADLTSKENNQNPGAQNTAFKLSKAEEALCETLKLNLSAGIVSIIETPVSTKTTRRGSADLLRPPLI